MRSSTWSARPAPRREAIGPGGRSPRGSGRAVFGWTTRSCATHAHRSARPRASICAWTLRPGVSAPLDMRPPRRRSPSFTWTGTSWSSSSSRARRTTRLRPCARRSRSWGFPAPRRNRSFTQRPPTPRARASWPAPSRPRRPRRSMRRDGAVRFASAWRAGQSPWSWVDGGGSEARRTPQRPPTSCASNSPTLGPARPFGSSSRAEPRGRVHGRAGCGRARCGRADCGRTHRGAPLHGCPVKR